MPAVQIAIPSSRERQRPCPSEGARELREDRQVGVQPNAIKPSDAEGEQRPLMLEPSKLTLNGATRVVERLRPLGVTRDQRVQPISLDPDRRGSARASRAAPFGRLALEVGPGKRPSTVLAAGRFVVATHDGGSLAKRCDGADAAI